MTEKLIFIKVRTHLSDFYNFTARVQSWVKVEAISGGQFWYIGSRGQRAGINKKWVDILELSDPPTSEELDMIKMLGYSGGDLDTLCNPECNG